MKTTKISFFTKVSQQTEAEITLSSPRKSLNALIQATLATEDANFYQHPGVDLGGIIRAVWIDIQGGAVLAGGSTITQQVARMLLLSQEERSEVSIRRKLRESILAIIISQKYTKDEILALYLNQSYYGSLAYGIEAASNTYFGKPSNNLDLAECALIAGLPQSPARYSPLIDPEAAYRRQKIVLGLMEQNGFITSEQRRLAENEELKFAADPYPMEAPHFSVLVKSQLDSLLSEEALHKGGLTVQTTLDLDMQKIAEQAIQRQLQKLAASNGGLGHNATSAALVAINPQNGAVLAMVGSPDYNDQEHAGAINMAVSPRQPGSALKPLLYAAALNPGPAAPWTAATMLLDVSQTFITHEGEAYTPANYDQRENGPVLVREALASSLNIPAVLTLQHVGVENFIHFSGLFGLDDFGDPDQYDLSLALGGGDVRLLDLTAAYGVFAAGGYQVAPYMIEKITNASGEIVYQHPDPVRQAVLDERVAWLISNILDDNAARILGFGTNSILRLDRQASVKTGTTSNFHDNWAIGYTPQLVAGVWAGNTSYQPMLDVSGVSGAAPIWADFMRSALNGKPEIWFVQPAGMKQVEICANSGMLPTPDCPYRKLEWFLTGTEPVTRDTIYHKVTLDRLTGKLATVETPPDQQVTRLALDLPPIAQTWAQKNKLLLFNNLTYPEGTAKNSPNSAADALRPQVLSPGSNSIYQIAPDLPIESQRLLISAAPGIPGAKLMRFYIDGILFAEADTPPYQAWWQLASGQHTIWVEVDSDSSSQKSAPVTITVK